MELLQDSIPKVCAVVTASVLYARASSSLLRPGLPRLVALLPVLAFLAAAPLVFTSSVCVRGTSAFFLAWLCMFKVGLLAAGRGPLDPSLPLLSFLFTALLPVKLRGAAGASKAKAPVSLVSCAVKVAVLAAVLRLYPFRDRPVYVRLVLYGVHMYCFLDLLLPFFAAVGGALGMEMEPQFDRPYLASSLCDFWGRRWNLMVSSILRASVFDPVCARAGVVAGVMASFAVSGLMHEVVIFYFTLQWPPTGQISAFFLIHGACCVAEGWCTRRWKAWGWPSPPRALATVMVLVLVTTTSFWLLFPPIFTGDIEDNIQEEWAAVGTFFVDAATKIGSMTTKFSSFRAVSVG